MASTSATISSDVLSARFAALRREGRRALVCYVTAGHPDRERSLRLLRGIASAGADVIEVGVPFSDPMADGPVIQASSQRAIEGGMTLEGTLALVAEAALSVPVVLFSYLNPLIAAGPDVLVRAAQAGCHGVLVTDLPLGADPARESWLGDGPLAFVRLVAPTTPASRMGEIARHGGGFVYLISRLGVTGEQAELPPELPATIARLRTATDMPICVGFGIARPDQAAAVSRLADGVVVGSALVRAADRDVDEAIALVADMRRAMDDAGPPLKGSRAHAPTA
jgi:tryptophan synthase alpha chain